MQKRRKHSNVIRMGRVEGRWPPAPWRIWRRRRSAKRHPADQRRSSKAREHEQTQREREPVRAPCDRPAPEHPGTAGSQIRSECTQEQIRRAREPLVSLPCIYIYESEAQVLIDNAARAGELETGNRLHGLLTPAGDFVVMFAAPPGPGCHHSSTHFSQDIEYLRRSDEYLFTRFGICSIGREHYHNYLGIEGPSSGDEAVVSGTMQRNGLKTYIEIVATANRRNSDIAFHSVVYSGANPKPQPCELRTIPGESPIRRACRGTWLSPHEEPTSRTGGADGRSCAPLRDDDPPAASEPEPPSDHDVPACIVSEIEQLPFKALEDALVTVQDNTVLVSIPAAGSRIAYIAYRASAPDTPIAAYLTAGADEDPRDMIAVANPTGEAVPLRVVYARINRAASTIQSTQQPQDGRPGMSGAGGNVRSSKAAGGASVMAPCHGTHDTAQPASHQARTVDHPDSRGHIPPAHKESRRTTRSAQRSERSVTPAATRNVVSKARGARRNEQRQEDSDER